MIPSLLRERPNTDDPAYWHKLDRCINLHDQILDVQFAWNDWREGKV